MGSGDWGETPGLGVNGSTTADSSSILVTGGDANSGNRQPSAQESAGGNAVAFMGSLNLTSNQYFTSSSAGSPAEFAVAGGTGGNEFLDGNAGQGGDAELVFTGAVSLDSSLVKVSGGSGGVYNGTSNGHLGTGGDGGNGGEATLQLTSGIALTANNGSSALEVLGGNGGQNDDSNGTALGVGGSGGGAALNLSGAVSADSSQISVMGGNAGNGWGSIGETQGSGGNTTASLSSLVMTSIQYESMPISEVPSSFSLMGGGGGADLNQGNGGNGGSVSLMVSGTLTVDSSALSVTGGSGGNSVSAAGGNGGIAAVSLGSGFALTSGLGQASFGVNGGQGGVNTGSGSGAGGAGGDGTWTAAGAVSVDSSSLQIVGGYAGSGFGSSGVTEGAGGNAADTLSSLTLTSVAHSNNSSVGTVASLTVAGGNGGADNYLGNGGRGGDAALSITGALTLSGAGAQITGGQGGSSVGANGGDGGNAILALSSAALSSASTVQMSGGNGGSGIGLGNGGNAAVSIGGLNLQNSTLMVDSGNGQTVGSVAVTLGDLSGNGTLYISGNGDNSLQVASGNFAGVLTGNVGLDKTGSGALTLSGANSYSGATTLDGGILNIQGDNNLGSRYQLDFNGGALQAGGSFATVQNADLLSSAATVDSNGHSVTWDGVISGSGTLAVTSSAGGGVLDLANANSYTGGTTIENTTLEVDSGGTLGSRAIGNGGMLVYINNAVAGSNPIDNEGALLFENNASAGAASIFNNYDMTFYDQSTAGSATILNSASGLLVFSSDGPSTFTSAGSATITNQGEVDFDGYATAGNAGIVNEHNLYFENNTTAGNSNILNRGWMEFDNNSTAANAEIDNEASITFFNSSTAGNANILNNSGINFKDAATAGNSTITNNSSMEFWVSSTAGSSTITNNNGSRIYFADNTTAANAVITNNGDMGFFGVSSAGNAVITTGNGGDLYFRDDSNPYHAQLIANGTGYVDFSGNDASTVTGTAVTVGSIAGSGTFYLGQIDLVTGVNNISTTVTGLISDGGWFASTGASLTKIGTGTLSLLSPNAFTGGANIDAGILVAGNSSALGGGASNNVALNGGTLMTNSASTGTPISILVGGNYNQAAGGTLQLGLAGTAPGRYDSLNTGGKAALGGTLAVTSIGGFQPVLGNNFLVVKANQGVTGTFSHFENEISGIRLFPIYQPDDVRLVVFPGSFAGVGLTPNARAVGGGLDGAFYSSSAQNLLSAMASQTTAQWAADLAQLSPAAVTPLFQMGFASAQAQAQVVANRLDALMAEADVVGSQWAGAAKPTLFASTLSPAAEMSMKKTASPGDRMCGFITGVGNFATVSGTGGVEGYSFTTGGVQAGVDYWFDPDVIVAGLLLGYNQADSTAADGGTVDSTGGTAGLYTGFRLADWRVTALVDGGMNSYKIQNPSLGGTASGAPQGLQVGGEMTLGLDLNASGFLVTPFASGGYEYVQVESFQQTGSGLLAPESFASQGEASLASQLGVKAGQDIKVGGDVKLTPSFLVSWDHLYQGNQDQLTASFGAPGSSFTVNGPSMGTDAAILGLGLQAQFAREITFLAQYQGRIGMSNNQAQQLTGGVEVGF